MVWTSSCIGLDSRTAILGNMRMQPALPACDDETLSTEGSFMQRRLFNQAIVASLVSPWLATGALAQTDYPNKPIRLIITHAAGGLPDTVARIYAQRLTTKLGISVLVDNKPGANGQLAAQAVSSSPADGYTFLVTDGSTFSINPRLYKSQNFDANKDFVPVSLLVRAPMFLAVQSSLGVNTLQELIALAKSKPGVLNYGSSGIGSTHHLCHETMNNALGLDILHVPFRGTAQSIPALVGGQVQLVFSAMPSLAGFVKGGQLKLLAVNSAQRSPLAPELPAVGARFRFLTQDWVVCRQKYTCFRHQPYQHRASRSGQNARDDCRDEQRWNGPGR
jgi:tripartite-type tricarboxylate transporter receptor subunit TctC